MRVPLEWLKQYVTIRLKPEALAHRLTMAGLEVAGIESIDGQPVFDVEVTPNRADWLSIIGVAREVAALTGQRLQLPLAPSSKLQAPSRRSRASSLEPQTPLTIQIEDRQGCSRYIGRVIKSVVVGPSPTWMQKRLIACGARPINNVVDITNYVLFEYGQPLHAFDYDRLIDRTILVRRALLGEPITTLDGVTRKLSTDILVIADGRQPVAIAGVMGGMGSEVTSQTRTVLLESALFDPKMIRRTARNLGLMSDSSYRFERGVDPAGVETASQRAAMLIREFAGGTETCCRDVGSKPTKRTTIPLDATHVTQRLGTSISAPTVRTILARLSCRVASGGTNHLLHVTVPSFRLDLLEEVDLIEELARITGYEHIPSTLPIVSLIPSHQDAATEHEDAQALRRLCASLGLSETITWSLVSESELGRCRLDATRAVRLANPLSQEHAYLRPSLLVGLLQAVRRNLTQGMTDIRLFEISRVMRPSIGEISDPALERMHVGIALSGWWTRDWKAKVLADFFHVKGLLAAVSRHLFGEPLATASASLPWAEPGQSATVTRDGRLLGVAGQVARTITHDLDIEHEVWYAELAIPSRRMARARLTVHAPSAFPPVKRDLSLIIDQQTFFATIHQAIYEAGHPLARCVELIDRYTGKQIPSGKTSLTFSIEYRDPTRTLTAEEVDVIHQRIGHVLSTRFGATLR